MLTASPGLSPCVSILCLNVESKSRKFHEVFDKKKNTHMRFLQHVILLHDQVLALKCLNLVHPGLSH
jgi:hypothetical protein